ncbi:MAG: hypothetical protein HYX87_01235 [Chloroflexi bacterium]|nr:hypothetical protein [Chloroflexota bacterium]
MADTPVGGTMSYQGAQQVGVPLPEVTTAMEWDTMSWKPQEKPNGRKRRGAAVATFARRLMAIERTRARRSRPRDMMSCLKHKKF